MRLHVRDNSREKVQVLAVAARAVVAVLPTVASDTNFDVHNIVQSSSVGLPSEIVTDDKERSNTK